MGLGERHFGFVPTLDPTPPFELRALRDAATNVIGCCVADAGIIRSLVREGLMHSPRYHSAGTLAIGYITHRGRQRDALCACEPIAAPISNQQYARNMNTVALEIFSLAETEATNRKE